MNLVTAEVNLFLPFLSFFKMWTFSQLICAVQVLYLLTVWSNLSYVVIFINQPVRVLCVVVFFFFSPWYASILYLLFPGNP